MTAPDICERILCGVDGSEAGLEAFRQAARLLAADGRLEVVYVVDLGAAAQSGFQATRVVDQLEAEGEEAIQQAIAVSPGASVEGRILHGGPAAMLLAEAKRLDATLVAVGSHGHSRAVGFALGSVSTAILRDAPTSVLVARAPGVLDAFPRAILAGLDGSPEAAGAVAVACSLAERFGASLRTVGATGGKPVAEAMLREAGAELRPGKPVDVLVEAGGEADLVVVGSRGLHGIRALGSVSERIAHRAPCSVLVVR